MSCPVDLRQQNQVPTYIQASSLISWIDGIAIYSKSLSQTKMCKFIPVTEKVSRDMQQLFEFNKLVNVLHFYFQIYIFR